MVHKIKNEVDGAIIILPDYIVHKLPQIKELENIFSKVLLYENGVMHNAIHRDDLLDVVDEYFSNFLRKNEVSLETCEDIIVGGAQEYFGLYLAHNNIPFTMLEEAAGIISRPNLLTPIAKSISENRYHLAERFGLLTGENELIKKIICNKNAQIKDFQFDKHEHFDVVMEMRNLFPEQLELIKKFFKLERSIDVEPNSALVLTQHFYNLGLMTFQQQKELYQTLLDYFFLDKNIVFKTHPDDVMYYQSLFPKSRVIRDSFPSELLPFVFTNEPEELVTITSTAVDALIGYKKPVRFSKFFEQDFNFIHGYYLALYAIQKFLDGYKLYTYNTDDLLIENLINYSDFKRQLNYQPTNLNEVTEGKCAVLVDDITSSECNGDEKLINVMNASSEDTVFLLLNSNKKYIFYKYPNKEIFSYISPIVWEQKLQKGRSNVNTIYVYSKNPEIRRVLRSMDFSRMQKYSNQEIRTRELNELEIKIKMLEGVLEATEKRLEHYIKLESELRELLKQKNNR